MRTSALALLALLAFAALLAPVRWDEAWDCSIHLGVASLSQCSLDRQLDAQGYRGCGRGGR